MHSNASGANAALVAFAALLANVVAVVLTPQNSNNCCSGITFSPPAPSLKECLIRMYMYT
jgi:hypothetical protein